MGRHTKHFGAHRLMTRKSPNNLSVLDGNGNSLKKLKDKQISIASVPDQYQTKAIIPTSLISHCTLPLRRTPVLPIANCAECTEWQRPISGVRSIINGKWKISPGWWGWESTPTSFHYIYHHVQSCGVRYRWEGRFTTPLSTLPQYVLCGEEFPLGGGGGGGGDKNPGY